MLRITEQRAPGCLVLKLEGRLSGAWVGEVETCWRRASQDGRSPIEIDLTDVSLVDCAGHALLGRMHRAGARFVTRGCLMRELVREIEISES